ncbi:MAG: type IV toxin-antitoxin system AbiEi family antitoxin domain-containing protein [Acidobacteriota bacterium]
MAEQTERKLNRLEHLLPEGLLADAAWLLTQGYSTSLRTQYVAAGWLSQPSRRVYQRGRGELTWQQAIVSLQTILDQQVIVGGRTALELQGYGHFLHHGTQEIHLYGPNRPPVWLQKLPLSETFSYRNSEPLLPLSDFPHSLEPGTSKSYPDDLTTLPYGQWNWPLTVSRPERALLELLDELPTHESFAQVDALVEGLGNLKPKLLAALLASCRSIKVKRLFFFFADRHRHGWLARIDRKAVDLGKGKRLLVRGGVLDPTYQITVPRDLYGVS